MELNKTEELYLRELIKMNLEEVRIRVGGFAEGKVKILDDRYYVLGYVEYSKYFDAKKFYDVELFIEAFSYVLRDVLSLTRNVGEIIIDSPSYFKSHTPKPSYDFFCGNNLFFEQNPLEKIFIGRKYTEEHIRELVDDYFGEILALGETFPSVSVLYSDDFFFIYASCVEFKTYKKLYHSICDNRIEMMKDARSIEKGDFYAWTNIDYYYLPRKEAQEADLKKAVGLLQDVCTSVLSFSDEREASEKKLIQEEFLFETSKSEKERDSLPIDMRVKNVVRYLLSYGFKVHNIVHCDFDEEGTMAVLVDDKDNRLSTLCPSVLGLYSDVFVYDIGDTDENSITEVFGDARDFLALPNPSLTEKEKEEAVWKILNQIEATCFADYNEAYRSVWEKTIMDKDRFVEFLEKKIKHYTDVLQSNKKPFTNLDKSSFEVYLKGATQSLETVTNSSSKFFVVVKTMDADNQWGYYLEEPLRGDSPCDAFQEFLDLYMSKTREYGLYKNYNLKEFSLDYFYEV